MCAQRRELIATSDANEGIFHIQKSLGKALISQKEFFAKKVSRKELVSWHALKVVAAAAVHSFN